MGIDQNGFLDLSSTSLLLVKYLQDDGYDLKYTGSDVTIYAPKNIVWYLFKYNGDNIGQKIQINFNFSSIVLDDDHYRTVN